MNYIKVEGLSKSYGEKNLFENITFEINRGDKKALLSRNGSGKTSLIHIITGQEVQDAGNVSIRPDLKIGYLEQEPQFDEALTVREILYNTDNAYIKAISEYHQALNNYQTEHSNENMLLVDSSTARMNILNAWDYDTYIAEILTRLGLSDIEQPVATLSGGQRKKLGLARVLIDETDLLILDEPTNHLDIEMIQWLEEYLKAEKITLFMVTHDRYFLDNVCHQIIEIDNRSLYFYNGNYSYYVEKKAEAIEIERKTIEKAKNIYRTELEWMRRMPQARTTKSKARIDAFYEIEKTATKHRSNDKTIFKVNVQRLGHKILEIDYITKRFGDAVLINDFSYIFKHGEKIGVAGLNGSGKSTLLNMITGSVKPDQGKITIGQTVKFGYYRQQGFIEDNDRTVINIMKEIAEEVTVGNGTISTSVFLQHFGFSFSEQHARFSTLSGGEKRKLYLLMILMQNPNFLILDEPTNDLDIATLAALEDFLASFSGCLLIVSHDRWFMDKLSDHIFAFEENGIIKDFPGNYSQYLAYREQQQKERKREPKAKIEKIAPKKSTQSIRPYIKEVENIEQELLAFEAEKKQLIEQLSENKSNDELTRYSNRIGEILQTIEQKMERWIELNDLIEQLKQID